LHIVTFGAGKRAISQEKVKFSFQFFAICRYYPTFVAVKRLHPMKLTVIGAGNMGGALIHGWAKSEKFEQITISDKSEQRLSYFKQCYPSIETTTDNVAAVADADIIVVVVKPWLMSDVLKEIKGHIDFRRQIVVSDAANFTTDKLALAVGRDGQYAYAIPNIAAEFGASMTFVTPGRATSEESMQAVRALYQVFFGEE